MTDVDLKTFGKTEEFAPSGSNQTGMRERNERLVLSILRRQGPLPKAEIARKTGLSAQTVSVIMRALEKDGLLERGEKLRGKVGQPSIPMRLAPDGAYFLGLKVGRRSAEMVLVNFVGQDIAQVTERHDYPTPDATLAFVKRAVDKVCASLPPEGRARVAGMGIASPFFLWEWGTVIDVDPAKMSAWRDFDLQAEVASLFDFPVYLGNDASSACGAELTFGTSVLPRDFIYLYIGYFVGGGVSLNGALYTGRTGNAGAIGPFPIVKSDGSLSQLVDTASLVGLERRLKDKVGHANAMTDQQVHWDIDQEIVDDWLAEAVPSLAQLIAGALSIIDFQTVLIDGNMPEAFRSTLVTRLDQEISKMALSGLLAPTIMPGTLGPRARPLGAASLPLSKRFMLEAS